MLTLVELTGPDAGRPELEYELGTVQSVRAWDYSRERFTGSGRDLNCYPGPDELMPPFASFVDDLYERQNELGRALMLALAEMYGLPRETFKDMFESTEGVAVGAGGSDFSTIRLLHYPGAGTEEEAAKATVGISAHTDFEAFTLMHQDAAGLQLMCPTTKSWVDAPVTPDFVVIVGDMLERLTNGVLKATPHRVALTAHPRNSIIRFNALMASVVVKPLPAFVTPDRPSAYTSVTMGTHMRTTMRNLQEGKGAWNKETGTSMSAQYAYTSPHKQAG